MCTPARASRILRTECAVDHQYCSVRVQVRVTCGCECRVRRLCVWVCVAATQSLLASPTTDASVLLPQGCISARRRGGSQLLALQPVRGVAHPCVGCAMSIACVAIVGKEVRASAQSAAQCSVWAAPDCAATRVHSPRWLPLAVVLTRRWYRPRVCSAVW